MHIRLTIQTTRVGTALPHVGECGSGEMPGSGDGTNKHGNGGRGSAAGEAT